jgi:hypothetical protein
MFLVRPDAAAAVPLLPSLAIAWRRRHWHGVGPSDPCGNGRGPVRKWPGTRAELTGLACYNSFSLCLLSESLYGADAPHLRFDTGTITHRVV